MASLLYTLSLTTFADRAATYICTEPGLGGPDSLTVVLPEDELVSEFGLVPVSLRVAVRVDSDTGPADAWLDTPAS